MNIKFYSMKVLLDVSDSKAEFIIELLKNFSFVRAKMISSEKAQLIEEIKDSVDYINLIKHGKAIGRDAKDLLNEL